MNPGALKTRGWLQSPSASQDEAGQPLTTWTNVAIESADVRYLSGLESIKAGAEASTVNASVRVRSRADLVAGMRYLTGTAAYHIKSAPPFDSSKRFMDLVCEVVT